MTPVELVCPRCGNDCMRDEVDVGVGVIFGPWGCYCGWSEDERYDQSKAEQPENGHRDQWGGFTPKARQV
jgi:hypothetical protein